ncbi:MAG: hypothetical protein ACOVMK_05480 [Arenimonas sp.]
MLLQITLVSGHQVAEHRGGVVKFFLHILRRSGRAIHIEDEMRLAVPCQNHRGFGPSAEIFRRSAFKQADVLHAQDRQGLMAQHLIMRGVQVPQAPGLLGNAAIANIGAQNFGRRRQVGCLAKMLINMAFSRHGDLGAKRSLPLQKILTAGHLPRHDR